MENSYKELQRAIKQHPKDEIDKLIEQYIYHKRNRLLLRRRLFDGIAFEPLSEEFGLTPMRCKDIVKECQSIVFEHLDI